MTIIFFNLWIVLVILTNIISADEQSIVTYNICEENAGIQSQSQVNLENFQKFLSSVPTPAQNNSKGKTIKNIRFIKQTSPCENETKSLTLDAHLASRGISFYPLFGTLKYNSEIFSPNEYCINQINPSSTNITMEVRVCSFVNSCEEGRLCIPKCCEVDQVWDLSEYPDGPIRCRPSDNLAWTPKIDKIKQRSSLRKAGMFINHPRNWCENDMTISSLRSSSKLPKKDFLKILEDGSVWIKKRTKGWRPLTPGSYCVDGAKNFEIGEKNSTYSGNYEDTILVDCENRSSNDKPCKTVSSDAYAISIVVASSFLLVTIIVYILLWEKQNIHGWTSLSYFSSLFGMYIFTALYRLKHLMFYGEDDSNDQSAGCFAIAIGTHFFWISTFCWMSCVNFDLWWTFRTLLPSGKSKGIKRFLLYSLFSLGIPSIIICVAVTIDQIYKDDLEPAVITPDYARTNCFMDEEYALLPYLYGPIAALMLGNLIFFTVTVYDMYKIQQSTKFASSSSSKTGQDKQSIKLFAKLFLLVGIPWAFEVVSWATTACGEISIFWSLADYINIFQAVAIFLTFVCKSETVFALETKFPSFQRFMKQITLSPERSNGLIERRPWLKFCIKPFTRKNRNLRGSSSAKTLSTGADSSKQSTGLAKP